MKSTITTEEFDERLIGMLSLIQAKQLLDIPGIYEIVSEEFNNDILEQWESDQEDEQEEEED